MCNQADMNEDIKHIRWRRLEQLLTERFSGVMAKLADRIEKSPTYTRAMLNPTQKGGRWIGESMAHHIEDRLGLPRGWLSNTDSDVLRDRNPSPTHGGEEQNFAAGPTLRGSVPLISWVQAGAMTEVQDQLSPGEALDWVSTTVQVRTNTFAVRVEGDSMEPDFPAGIILVVEPEMQAENGDFVIVRNGADEATFKQLVKDGADWYLKPINPRYPIKPLSESRIVGVVREAVRKFR